MRHALRAAPQPAVAAVLAHAGGHPALQPARHRPGPGGCTGAHRPRRFAPGSSPRTASRANSRRVICCRWWPASGRTRRRRCCTTRRARWRSSAKPRPAADQRPAGTVHGARRLAALRAGARGAAARRAQWLRRAGGPTLAGGGWRLETSAGRRIRRPRAGLPCAPPKAGAAGTAGRPPCTAHAQLRTPPTAPCWYTDAARCCRGCAKPGRHGTSNARRGAMRTAPARSACTTGSTVSSRCLSWSRRDRLAQPGYASPRAAAMLWEGGASPVFDAASFDLRARCRPCTTACAGRRSGAATGFHEDGLRAGGRRLLACCRLARGRVGPGDGRARRPRGARMSAAAHARCARRAARRDRVPPRGASRRATTPSYPQAIPAAADAQPCANHCAALAPGSHNAAVRGLLTDHGADGRISLARRATRRGRRADADGGLATRPLPRMFELRLQPVSFWFAQPIDRARWQPSSPRCCLPSASANPMLQGEGRRLRALPLAAPTPARLALPGHAGRLPLPLHAPRRDRGRAPGLARRAARRTARRACDQPSRPRHAMPTQATAPRALLWRARQRRSGPSRCASTGGALRL